MTALKEKINELSQQKREELQKKLGEIYEQNKENLAYYVEQLAICEATILFGIEDENVKRDLEYLLIGFESEVEKMTYQAGDAAVSMLKELLQTVTKTLIQVAMSKVDIM